MEQNSVSGISNFLGSFTLVIRVTFTFFALLSKKKVQYLLYHFHKI